MAGFFKSIVMSAAGIIVFGSVCEMILPDNAYKKYVHLAIGLMLILTFLSPFINRNYRLEFEIPSSAAAAEIAEKDEKTRKEVIRIYTKKLNERISESISEATETKANAECEINENDDKFGKIERVGVTVTMPSAIDAERINNIIKDKIYDTYGVDKDKISVKFFEGK